MIELIPVVEAEYHEVTFDWAPVKPREKYIALNADISDTDLAWIVAFLANYNHVCSTGSAA